MATPDANFLDGQLLIAMPGMGDPRFERAVIFICSHSEDGAMGLMINKPAPELHFNSLLKQLEISSTAEIADTPVHFGGPVEYGRGFVLHSGEYAVDTGSMKVNPSFSMTATLEVLQDIAQGKGPQEALLLLGYSGWGPGQLEHEIQDNGWLTTTADPGLVFAEPAGEKWTSALKSLNIDPLLLSSGGGRA